LTNAPAAFMEAMNGMLHEYLDDFVVILHPYPSLLSEVYLGVQSMPILLPKQGVFCRYCDRPIAFCQVDSSGGKENAAPKGTAFHEVFIWSLSGGLNPVANRGFERLAIGATRPRGFHLFGFHGFDRLFQPDALAHMLGPSSIARRHVPSVAMVLACDWGRAGAETGKGRGGLRAKFRRKPGIVRDFATDQRRMTEINRP
ncbi:MAG: hypothetical protein P8X69_08450, partial [Maritimibacter sp.]